MGHCSFDIIIFYCLLNLSNRIKHIYLYPMQYSYPQQTPTKSIRSHNQAPTEPGHNDSQLKSQLFYESRREDNLNTSQMLDSIEEQIKDIQVKLKNVQQQKNTVSASSEEFAQLQQERKQLKKQLIDLDYQHKVFCEKYRHQQLNNNQHELKAKEQTNEEPADTIPELQRKYESEYLAYSRKVEEQLKKIEQASKERALELEKVFADTLNQQLEKETAKEEAAEKTLEQIDDQLALARYHSKIAEIQLQLTSDALRRSRYSQLQSELAYLRTDPLLTRYDILGSHYVYPEVSLYRPYLGMYPELAYL